MKFYLSLIILLATINVAFGQNQAYTNDFKTPQQIRNYFASNIANIKPIEGEYDMQMTYKTNSPFVNDGSFNSVIFIVSDPITNEIYLCANDNGRIRYLGDPKIEQIGTTNAYRVYWGNSSNRGILENGLRLVVSIELSQADSRKFAGNNNFAYRLVLSYDMVKRYPTGEMYANAARRAIEESQPKEWTGTGFALTNNYIVTNNHVVDGAKTIFIQGVNGDFNHKYHAEVVNTDKVNDLAIIKVNGVNIPSVNIPYAVKTNTAEVGEEVFVLGYPLTSTMGEEIKLTTGVISSKTGFQGDVSIYQISAPIQPGNSGGPLFDSKGNVIGIVSAKHKGAENVGYAIKASYLKNLMESSISTNILPQTNKIQTKNLSGKVKSVKNYVYYIVCSSQNYTNNSTNFATNNGTITITNPSISNKFAKSLTLISVAIKPNETVLTISCKNDLVGGWMNIDKNAYIMANGTKYMLTGIEGIAYSPNYTSFSYQGESKTFKLHFQAIPQNTSSIDFIESPSSQWRLYGIKLQ